MSVQVKCHMCLLEQKYKQLFKASKYTMFHNARTSHNRTCCICLGSLHRIQHKHTRKMPMPCCQICEWGLLKRKQCYIYAKGTKMATFATKKNQQKNGNDVQEAMTKNCQYHSREYRPTNTHTILQQFEHGIACLQC